VFLQYFDTVGWVFWPVKTVAHITYTVLVETLNLGQSISQSCFTRGMLYIVICYLPHTLSAHWKRREYLMIKY